MRHRMFAKIAGPHERAAIAAPGGAWVALEKIHGAQMVIGVAGGAVRFGKRKAWLAEAESFFGWQLLRAELTVAAQKIAHTLGAPQVFLYGELFGGAYPHPSTPAVAGLSAVQTGIWYAPDLHFAIFDALVAPNDDDQGELIAHTELRALANAAHLITPPLLKSGTRQDVESAPVRYATRVPALFGLPAIDGNIAEGFVMKPDARALPSQRAVYKRKITEFDEKRFDEAESFDASKRLTGAELNRLAERLVNGARIASARSKVGTEPAAIIDEVVLDVLVDLEEAFPAAVRGLAASDEEALTAAIRQRARTLVVA